MGDKVRLLSDAIRLGATIHPQIRGSLFGWEYVANPHEAARLFQITGTCALGAAAVAIGKFPERISDIIEGDFYFYVQQRFPTAGDTYRCCPVAECPIDAYIPIIVTHLNDGHEWSREKIADWLEGLGF